MEHQCEEEEGENDLSLGRALTPYSFTFNCHMFFWFSKLFHLSF